MFFFFNQSGEVGYFPPAAPHGTVVEKKPLLTKKSIVPRGIPFLLLWLYHINPQLQVYHVAGQRRRDRSHCGIAAGRRLIGFEIRVAFICNNVDRTSGSERRTYSSRRQIWGHAFKGQTLRSPWAWFLVWWILGFFLLFFFCLIQVTFSLHVSPGALQRDTGPWIF